MTKPTLRVPAVIRKHEIAVYAALRGTTNDVALKLAGIEYEPETLKFVEFYGKVQERQWVGDYLFHVGTFADAPKGDLSKLPGVVHGV